MSKFIKIKPIKTPEKELFSACVARSNAILKETNETHNIDTRFAPPHNCWLKNCLYLFSKHNKEHKKHNIHNIEDFLKISDEDIYALMKRYISNSDIGSAIKFSMETLIKAYRPETKTEFRKLIEYSLTKPKYREEI